MSSALWRTAHQDRAGWGAGAAFAFPRNGEAYSEAERFGGFEFNFGRTARADRDDASADRTGVAFFEPEAEFLVFFGCRELLGKQDARLTGREPGDECGGTARSSFRWREVGKNERFGLGGVIGKAGDLPLGEDALGVELVFQRPDFHLGHFGAVALDLHLCIEGHLLEIAINGDQHRHESGDPTDSGQRAGTAGGRGG